MPPAVELVHPRTNRYLSGRFAPAHREITVATLAVEGDLPSDLSGRYVRNADEFAGPPRARVRIPQLVPNGRHGNWFPA